MMFRFLIIGAAALLLAGCHGWHGKHGMHGGGADREKPVVLINTFTVPAGKTEEAVAAWEVARDFLREQDGYISTRLHMALGADARYQLINIAKWESPEQFRSAVSAMRAAGVLRGVAVAGVVGDPNLYTVIRRDKPRGYR